MSSGKEVVVDGVTFQVVDRDPGSSNIWEVYVCDGSGYNYGTGGFKSFDTALNHAPELIKCVISGNVIGGTIAAYYSWLAQIHA